MKLFTLLFILEFFGGGVCLKLLARTTRSITVIDVDPTNTSNVSSTILVPSVGQDVNIFLAADVKKKTGYYLLRESLFSLNLVSGASVELGKVGRHLDDAPSTFDYDYITENIYIGVQGTIESGGRIEVCSLKNVSTCAVVLHRKLDYLYSMVLDSDNRVMYWHNGITSNIEKASMDGTDHIQDSFKIMSTGTHSTVPRLTSLSLHSTSRRIIFVRSVGQRSEVVACPVDNGNDCSVLARSQDIIHLAVSEKQIIWSMGVEGILVVCDIDNCESTKKNTTLSDVETFIVLDNNLQSVEEKPNPCESSKCSDFCILSQKSPNYTCICPVGIALRSDNRTCSKTGITKALFIAALNGIYTISLDTPDMTAMRINFEGHESGNKVDDIDIDAVNKKIYWLEGIRDGNAINKKYIKRCDLDGTNTQSILLVPSSVRSIRIDVASQNLYWIDEHASSRLGVTSLVTKYSKTIFFRGLRRAKSFAIHQSQRKIFVASDRDENGIIEKFNMDGGNRTRLLDLRPGQLVINLSVDEKRNVLYWTETNTTDIFSLDLTTGGSSKISSYAGVRSQQPNSITILNDILYATSIAGRTILQVPLSNLDVAGNIDTPIFGAGGMKAVSLVETGQKNDCSVLNGNCEHICIDDRNGPHKCLCADGFTIDDSGNSCRTGEPQVVFASNQNFVHLVTIRRKADEADLLSSYHHVVRKIIASTVDNVRSEVYISGVCADGNGCILRSQIPVPSSKDVLDPLLTPELVINDPSLNGIFGIAIDEVSRNIFWTNSLTNRIEMCDSSCKYRKVLAWRGIRPRSIAVYLPRRSIIYFDDGTSGSIKSLPISGEATGGMNLISDVKNLTSMVIDKIDRQIYWSEHSSAYFVYVADFEGEQREILYAGKDSKPTQVMYHDEYLFFAENNVKTGSIGYYNGRVFAVTHSNLPTITSGSIFEKKELTVHDRRECLYDNTNCDQLCLVTPDFTESRFKRNVVDYCACSDTFTYEKSQNDDYPQCRPVSNAIISVNNKGIFMLPLTRTPGKALTWQKSAPVQLPIRAKKLSPISVSFHVTERILFWIEREDPTNIHLASIDYPYKTASEPASSTSHCTYFVALTVDAAGNQIYVSCYRNSTGFIAVFSIKSPPNLGLKYSGIVLSGDTVASSTGYPAQPRDVAVFPLRNILFYVDANAIEKISIVKCTLDGRKCSIWFSEGISTNTRLQADPNIESSRLFYTCRSGVWSRDIASAMSRVRQHVIASDSGRDIFEFAVAPIDEYSTIVAEISHRNSRVYDWPSNETISSLDDTFLLSRHASLDVQSKTCRQAGCSHMCRYVRDKDSPANERFECLCPVGLALSTYNERQCVPSLSCLPWQFSCSDGQQCIHAAKKCDRVNDCNDQSDESPSICRFGSDMWPCDDGTNSVNRTLVCDGFTQCTDASDELHCRCERPHETFDCGAWSHSASDRCVPRTSLCDRVPDCELAEDEGPMICLRFGAADQNTGWLYSVLFAIAILIMLILVLFCCTRQEKQRPPQQNSLVVNCEVRNESVLLLQQSIGSRPTAPIDQLPMRAYSVTNSSSTCFALPPPNSSFTASKPSSVDIPPHYFYAPPPSTASMSTYGVVKPADIHLTMTNASRRQRTHSPSSSEDGLDPRTSTPRMSDSQRNFEHHLRLRPTKAVMSPVIDQSSTSLSSHSSDDAYR